jgi:hypothetical protein
MLEAQKELIEEVAQASGLSVTDWARDTLLQRATEQKMDLKDGDVQRVALPKAAKSPSKPPPPKRTKSGTQMKAVRPEDIEQEPKPLLIAGMKPILA